MAVSKKIEELNRDRNKPWSLVLGGGAARGLVHIGVWKFLQEKKLIPSEIVGNSMGAIIGAAIALGYDWNYILSKARYQSWKKMVDLDLKWGLIKGDKVNKILIDFYGNRKFKDAEIPLKLISFDLDEGKKLVISNGLIWEGVRSSINIPIVFSPFKFKNSWVVDGGVVSNLPVEEAKYEQVIAVSSLPIQFPPRISDRKIYKNKNRRSSKLFKEVMYRTFLAVMKNNQKYSLLQASDKKILLIDANPGWEFKHYQFEKADEMTNLGYEIISGILGNIG